MLMEMGGSVYAQAADGATPLHFVELHGPEVILSFMRKKAKNNRRRPKSTATSVVDPAARATAEAAAAAIAAVLIAEEEDQKQALPCSKQGSSNKSRKHRNRRRKSNIDELDTSSEGHKAISGSVTSRSGKRGNAGERDDMAREAARHYSKPDGEVDAHGVVAYGDGIHLKWCV
jgi:hypothetical protein